MKVFVTKCSVVYGQIFLTRIVRQVYIVVKNFVVCDFSQTSKKFTLTYIWLLVFATQRHGAECFAAFNYHVHSVPSKIVEWEMTRADGRGVGVGSGARELAPSNTSFYEFRANAY